MDKIKDLSFAALSIVLIVPIWSLINMHLLMCGRNPISGRNQKVVQTVGNILSLMMAKMYNQEQIVFEWKSPEWFMKETGIVSRTMTIHVD